MTKKYKKNKAKPQLNKEEERIQKTIFDYIEENFDELSTKEKYNTFCFGCIEGLKFNINNESIFIQKAEKNLGYIVSIYPKDGLIEYNLSITYSFITNNCIINKLFKIIEDNRLNDKLAKIFVSDSNEEKIEPAHISPTRKDDINSSIFTLILIIIAILLLLI